MLFKRSHSSSKEEHPSNSASIVICLTSETTLRTFYKDFVQYLVEQGWNVNIITSETKDLTELSIELGANIHPVQMSRSASPINDLQALIKIYKILRQVRPELVVSATPKVSLLAMFSAFLLGVPSRLYQIWGLRFESTWGVHRHFLLFMERLTAGFSTDVIANSQSLATEVLQHRISKQIRVIGAGSSHGINITKFDPLAPYEIESLELKHFIESKRKESIVLYLGRVTRDKGVDTLLKAFEIAQTKGRKFNLVIAGEIEDEQLAIRIKQMTGENLFLSGHVEDVRPLLSVSDILCLPTLREGFPNVVLEAAAMCVPAIVSNATGSVDSVEDGITGIVFPVGNAEYLEEKIHALFKSTELLSSMGKAARERAVQFYSQESFFTQIGSYFLNLIDRTKF